jgi:hypothetical protein
LQLSTIRKIVVKKIVKIFRIWMGALIPIIGAAIVGCFPADEGAPTPTASISIPLTDVGVSSTAFSNWLDWRKQKITLPTFDLGATRSDFYFGLHIKAGVLVGESIDYYADRNDLVATVGVQDCNQCAFEVTIFIVSTSIAALPVRVVKTLWGISPEVTIAPQGSTSVNIDVKQLDVGQISCSPRNNPPDGYELSAVDITEGVRFPSAVREAGSLNSGVVLSNIPYGRTMNIQVRKIGVADYTSATDKLNGYNEINLQIPGPGGTADCIFDMP